MNPKTSPMRRKLVKIKPGEETWRVTCKQESKFHMFPRVSYALDYSYIVCDECGFKSHRIKDWDWTKTAVTMK